MSTQASPASGEAESAPAPGVPAMTSDRWEQWGDRLNPLVVKEVRQGLRTRVFWVSFGLLLAACLVLSLIAFANTHDSAYTREGSQYFFSFFICLALVLFGVIPFNAYRSLAREREDETWSLLLLTGLGPRRILLGKVASFLVQAVLYASAVGPFLLFSYFLNGISLPTILMVLLYGATWMVFLTLVSVCAATLADSRMGRAAVRLLLVGALLLSLFQTLTLAFVVTQERGSGFSFDREFFCGLAALLWVLVSNGWLVFEVAVSRLSLVTEDYTRHPRRALVAQVVVTFVGMTAMWWFLDRKDDIPTGMGFLGGLHLIFASLFMGTDVDGQARPLRAGTRVWSLLKPGALRGFRLSVLLLLGWAAGCSALVWASQGPTGGARLMMSIGALALYGVLYLSVALLLGRLPGSGRFASPVSVRLLYILAGVVGAGVPPLLAAFLGLEGRDELLNLLNPVLGTLNFGRYDYSGSGGLKMTPELLLCVALVALLAAFAADRVLADRERRVHQQ
ncbi:ABC transporter permease [Corallococcus sp. EGB]|uniref:ABC transporter permease n=1 Tax=Corallococcus sp. EGB TaxID=1521117 RepID=UPI001CBEF67F|nr:ABC transporter permease [Corallococcus sp. EGB]